MRKQLCDNPECQHLFEVTFSNVERRRVIKGYKYDYYGYFVRCPECGEEKEVGFFSLPPKIAFGFLKQII